MAELAIFAASLLTAAVFDIKAMLHEAHRGEAGRGETRRELALYALICAAALALGAVYLPAERRHSIMSALLELFDIRKQLM
ncbi:MAG: hypothetical protein LBH17_00725 [Oscillospiraceae bacterium]|nr:hypothetical protein [Oscillospiraceae bacterium]